MPYMRNEQLKATAHFADNPDVLEFQRVRGWVLTDPPKDAPAPEPVAPPEWVTLYHPELQTSHEFPNNPDALAGATGGGWITADELAKLDEPDDPPPAKKRTSKPTDDQSETE